ncbi:hypothetical protein DV515_00008561 [Chloebia gouldiae]|uniref:Uncharacterized protein n=1 Tax=Chloebia gouldiae TaxID=44316 RepID=A0A3L8SFV2_CHLGU|nr:hypothetical protein DV515_00008561 [Chloebia gouldiae]
MGNGMCSRKQKRIFQTLLLLTVVFGFLYGAMLYYELQGQLRKAEATALKYQQHQESLSAQLQGSHIAWRFLGKGRRAVQTVSSLGFLWAFRTKTPLCHINTDPWFKDAADVSPVVEDEKLSMSDICMPRNQKQRSRDVPDTSMVWEVKDLSTSLIVKCKVIRSAQSPEPTFKFSLSK